MSEYFQFLKKPERVEEYLDTFLSRVEEKIPGRGKINSADSTYQDLALRILQEGKHEMDRTGTGTVKLFAESLKFDLSNGKFPLLTTKKIHTRSVFGELIWFIHGGTNVGELHDMGITIWDEWADKNGNLGPVYGHQWRSWDTADGRSVDQLAQAIGKIRNKPTDRRIIVSAWNVGEIDKMALPPCHLFYQFDVEPNREGNRDCLNLQMYQRSADYFLGVPFNIASYAALLSMAAQVTDKTPHKLTINFGNVHFYTNHLKQILVQLSRDPYPAPRLWLNPDIKEIDDFKLEDIKVQSYKAHTKISAPISV